MDTKELFLVVLKVLALLFFLGLGTERGMQAVKSVLSLLSEHFKQPLLKVQDKKTFILVVIAGLLLTFQGDVEVVKLLKVFGGLDPELVKVIDALLIAGAANWQHNTVFKGK